MADFDVSFRKLEAAEGKWVLDPRDSGGETYRGISRRNWPRWDGWKAIDLVRRGMGYAPKYGTGKYVDYVVRLNDILDKDSWLQERVRDFYIANFWTQSYTLIEDQELVDWMFSLAVNTGMSPNGKSLPHKWVQQALGGIVADGIIGPVTRKAIKDTFDVKVLLEGAKAYARTFYRDLVKRDPSKKCYLKGWLRRVG